MGVAGENAVTMRMLHRNGDEMPRSEATCVVGISRRRVGADRLLSYDEMCDFVDNAADHLHSDSRVIDPVLCGQAGTGEIEITFGLRNEMDLPSTHVECFDVMHDMGAALGAVWSDSIGARSVEQGQPPEPVILEWRSRLLQAVSVPADSCPQ